MRRPARRVAVMACLLVAGCGKHPDDARVPAVPPLKAHAGPMIDAFWALAAPAIVGRYEDGPKQVPVSTRDMQPRLITVAADGRIEAGEFTASAVDATWWALRRNALEGGGTSTVWTLGGAGWHLDTHRASNSPLTEVTIDREGLTPQILYSFATTQSPAPAPAPAPGKPLYQIAAALLGGAAQTLPAPGKATVDLAAGHVVLDGRSFSLAGTRNESVQYSGNGDLSYLGVTARAEALAIAYHDGKLTSVSGP